MMSRQAKEFWNLLKSCPKQIDMPLAPRREAGEHAEDATAEPVSYVWSVVKRFCSMIPCAWHVMRGSRAWTPVFLSERACSMYFRFGPGPFPRPMLQSP